MVKQKLQMDISFPQNGLSILLALSSRVEAKKKIKHFPSVTGKVLSLQGNIQ